LLAQAEHHPPPLIDFDYTAVVQLGIFLVLLFVLTKLVFRPYLALLRERSENIDGAREQAVRDSTDAEKKMADYEERLIKARKEAAAVRTELRAEGEQTAAEVLGKARDESEAKVRVARQKIEKSTEAAKLSLRTRADAIAKDIASRLLGREV
jgi:F-type H+-transporting ATPase subunit b